MDKPMMMACQRLNSGFCTRLGQESGATGPMAAKKMEGKDIKRNFITMIAVIGLTFVNLCFDEVLTLAFKFIQSPTDSDNP